ncbi:MAG: hypothetical protein ABI165_11875, partial [Bryobacteraceae bacterium]
MRFFRNSRTTERGGSLFQVRSGDAAASCALLILLLAPLLSFAATPRPKIPAELEALIELSHSAPPEFAADALLRIVESGRIADRDTKRELIEQAFQLATRAQQPVRLVSIPGTPIDTRAGYRGRAMRLGLDALSLECRAIRDLLPLDKPRARELFTNIVKPALEPRTCEDALVYDVDDFYQTLQQVLAAAFTPAEREKDEQVQFLTLHLSRITAHAELAPAARIVAGQGLTPAQLQVAEGAFLARLESMPSDDRSFSVAVAPLEQSVSMLAQSLSSAGLATDGLVGGFHKYLTANLSGARCGDNAGAMTRTSEPAKVVEWFNSQFHGDTP